MRHGHVTPIGAQQHGREKDRMEGHVILGHELIKGDICTLLWPPPLLELLSVRLADRQVPDRSVEPYIEHLMILLLVKLTEERNVQIKSH